MNGDFEFGKRVYNSVESIVLSDVFHAINVSSFEGHVKMGVARGEISGDFHTLIYNSGKRSDSSEKYVQILSHNGQSCYTVRENGASDKKLPADLLNNLRAFKYLR